MLDRNNSTIVTRSAAKRRKLDDEKPSTALDPRTNLLDISDDVLLIIFSFIQPQDLINLSESCLRFANLVCDRSLWEHVDLRSTKLTQIELENYIRYLQKNTKYLATRGFQQDYTIDPSRASITQEMLKNIVKNAPNIETLIIEDHLFDCSKIFLDEFPPSLQVLRLCNCQMIRMPLEKSFFYRVEKLIPRLRVLDLSDSHWFVPHTLLALSKSPNLEELILRGCNVTECLPYASLAANFGFSILKTLDLRNTSITDIELTCFNRTTSLRHLYLGCNPGEATGQTHVTDYSMTTFGGGPREPREREREALELFNPREAAIIIEIGACPRPVCHLESLILHNYPGITDRTLNHAAASMLYLKFLDVSHTGVTLNGIRRFKESRPEVKLVTTMEYNKYSM